MRIFVVGFGVLLGKQRCPVNKRFQRMRVNEEAVQRRFLNLEMEFNTL